jgi:hypothetical protein
MAQNVIINGVTYQSVPEVDIPKNGGGTAKFVDTSDATATSAQIRPGATAYVNGTKVTGSMTEKAAASYTPGTADQSINANQYLTAAQTIKGDANLVASNIVAGKSIFGVAGSATLPSISQDSTTKVLTIS